MLKKIFSCSLAVVLALLGVFSGWGGTCSASAANGIKWESVFDLAMLGDSNRLNCQKGWVAALKTALGDSTELVFPDKYRPGDDFLDEQLGGHTEEYIKENLGNEYLPYLKEQPVELGSQALTNTSKEPSTEKLPNITSVVFGTGIELIDKGGLFRFPNLEKVTFKADGMRLPDDFAFLGNTSSESDAGTYASKIKEIHIDGATIGEVDAAAFSHINLSTLKIYVTSGTVKAALQTAVPALTDDNFVDPTQDLPVPDIEVSGTEIHKGEVFAPTVNITKGDQTQDDVIIDNSLYKDEKCEQKTNKYYYSPGIPEGTYYLKVTLKATENYQGLEKAIQVKVVGNENVNKTALETAIAEAEQFDADNKYKHENYKKEDWDAFQDQLKSAKYIYNDKDGSFTQAQVDDATTKLTAALDAVKKSVADNTEAWNKLQEAIQKAEAMLADKDKYTEESWKGVDPEGRIADAKALKKEDPDTTVTKINLYIDSLGFSGLKLKPVGPSLEPGSPFAYIKTGSQEKVLSMTAPEKLAGATKVRVTFQCAEDVSFNANASIDITANVAGEDNYQRFPGTGGYETGVTCTVVLPLSEAVKAGDLIELFASTGSWDNAKDYVYAITAIEFVDANDKALGAYIDKDVFKENLATAIKEAEAINTSTYTAESVEKLTKALADAKALKEDATAEEMKKAIDAINDAIKGLTKRDEDEEAKEKLTAKVKEAEAIDTSLYTPESVEKLTKALADAKALKEDASAEEINKVLAAIDEAIKGLVKKDGSGGNNDPQKPADDTKVIGVAKGKTFTAGNFKYKVSAAATMTGTVKTAGKVTVVSLSKTGKKKSSINVKNTVSASGASYQVTGIGSKAFRKAAKLKKATLGSNVKSISANAFENCKKLSSVKATGVTKIGKKAFMGCKALGKLTFGKKKITSVSKGAFKGCKKKIKVAGGSKKVKKGNIKKLKKSGYKKFK